VSTVSIFVQKLKAWWKASAFEFGLEALHHFDVRNSGRNQAANLGLHAVVMTNRQPLEAHHAVAGDVLLQSKP
jgi:hypothetical protein